MPDKLWKLIIDENRLNKYFLHFLLQDTKFKTNLTKDATGTSGSMLNISMEKSRNLDVVIPKILLQNKFSQIVEKTESAKAKMKAQLAEMDNNFNGLMAEAFRE